MNHDLDKETYKYLCNLYAEYLRRRKNGQSRESAMSFSPKNVYIENPDDFWSYISVLKNEKLIEGIDLAGNFSLSYKAIAFMEGRFKNELSEVIDVISKLKP